MKLKAYWIGNRNVDQFTATVYRKDFILNEKANSAVLKVTATNRFQFWVNGKSVAYGPKRTHEGFKEYDTVDISEYLQVGRNSLAAVVIYSPSCKIIQKDGLIAQVDINLGDKDKTIITDSSWVFALAEWYGTSSLTVSSGTELQEHFDSGKLPLGWQTEEYPLVPDDAETVYLPSNFYKKAECERYQPVTVFGPYYTSPWIDVIERTTKMEQFIPFNPSCVWLGSDSKELWNIQNNLAIKFNEQKKVGEKVELNQKTYTNQNHNIFVFDLLKTRFVRPGISVKNFSGNVRIEMYYCIGLKNVPDCDRGFGGVKEGFCDSFVPSKDNLDWHSVTAKGFRFMTVRIAGDGEVEFSPNCQLIEYPFGEMNKPQIKSDILSKAWDIGAETIRSATTDYYVDTCWRENALWTYDACVTGRAAYDTFNETAMWKNSMLGIARSISEFGVPHSMAIPFGLTLIDQNLIWAYYCLEFYNLTNGGSTANS